ncbi:dTDP-4-dehydrorhamnose reductase [Bacillus sp. FJAT-50079]|nr:dTDP-4-dehydrorhamnose reductase [Bacillus sp. FJAT-50079]MBS4208553.1 dTDP-4-dehydrorhamnose reductase [Bacillus sp. FJAT-50079]
MQVLVTGATGQLGLEIIEMLQSRQMHEYVGVGRNELDITSMSEVKRVISTIKPDVIIHLAAYTQVDMAEQNSQAAYAVNAYGTRNIAVLAQNIGAKLLYVSTDYVFNGEKGAAYDEFDSVSPISIYGKSKAAGEAFVRELCLRHFIVRTSWLYGQHGNNFVKKILALSNDKENISIVSDQIGSPTYTVDLCRFLLALIGTEKYGTYHMSNSGFCSWFEFAKAIIDLSGSTVNVHACQTDRQLYPAPRPIYSVLNHQGLILNGFEKPRMWQEALNEFINGEKIDKEAGLI